MNGALYIWRQYYHCLKAFSSSWKSHCDFSVDWCVYVCVLHTVYECKFFSYSPHPIALLLGEKKNTKSELDYSVRAFSFYLLIHHILNKSQREIQGLFFYLFLAIYMCFSSVLFSMRCVWFKDCFFMNPRICVKCFSLVYGNSTEWEKLSRIFFIRLLRQSDDG